MKIAPALIVLLALAGLGAARAPARFGQIDDARIARADAEPQNWMVHGGDQQAHRFSGLDQINPGNIARLKPAWSLEFDTKRGQEATPIVVDGVAYVTTAWSKVYAVDARTGRRLWFYDPKVRGDAGVFGCCDVVSRGAAVYRGRVYVATFDARLIALNARTGKPVWSAEVAPADSTYTISGAPRVAGGLVYIGNAGGEFGGRGYVSAYDAGTGKLVWRFFTTPGDPAKADGAISDEPLKTIAQPTWFGPHTDYRGGGHVWNSMVYDADFDQLYIATGNGYPWHRKFRSEGRGDNLFISSIVALDAKTGRYKWHYQETPGDSWDYDAIADMILADLTIDGRPRKALMHTPKNGFFYVLDRATGKLISADPFVSGVTWAKGVDLATGRPQVDPAAYFDTEPVRVGPSGGGAHSWQPTAFSPRTGLFYLQAVADSTSIFLPKTRFEYRKGVDNTGIYSWGTHAPGAEPPAEGGILEGALRPPTTPARPLLIAWDPVARQPAWTTPATGSGVLATAGNLVFLGRSRNVMGELVAFRADTGVEVWKHPTPNAIITAPVSYAVDGEQYILMATGAGGGAILAGGPDVRENRPGRLVAFKLDGKGVLPPDPPPAPLLPPPEEHWPAATVLAGEDHYAQLCARCHGVRVRSSNIVPDLRRSKALASKPLWSAIVEGGALKATGMVSWAAYMPPGGAEAIRAYVAEEARKAQASR